jgi:hypothetical protein
MNREITAKNYFEHIENIGTANFLYAEKETEYLYLLVLTSKKADFEGVDNVPRERYGEKLEDWQIYQNETIYEVLEEFKEKSTISLSIYFLDKGLIEMTKDLEDDIEPHTKDFVLIADAFSLDFVENQKIAKLFNSKDRNKVGGFLVPICSEYSDNQSSFARTKVEDTFKRLTKAWGTEFYKSYSHIELDIPNKTHFFRRLANIAYLKGIAEKGSMAKFETTSKQLKQPSLKNI